MTQLPPIRPPPVFETTVLIDGVELHIVVPRPLPGSAAANAKYELALHDRCTYEKCQHLIPLGKSFCEGNICRQAHYYLLRKLGEDLLSDPKCLPFSH